MKIHTKVLIGMGLAASFAGMGIVTYSRAAVHGALVARLEQAGKQNVHESTTALATAVASADERLILPLLHTLLQANGAAYTFVLDRDGRVLAHSNVAEVGQMYQDDHTIAGLTSERTLAVELDRKGKAVLDMAVPIFREAAKEPADDFLLADARTASAVKRIGTLRIGLPLDAVLASEHLISARILRVVLILGGVTGLLLFAFMRHVLAPIGLLAAATAKIRGGDYCGIIPVTSNDEIGDLARSFNAMSRELGETTISKEFFTDILNSIQDQVIVTDAAGMIVLVNPAVVKLLGWTREELCGRPAATLLGGSEISFAAPTRSATAQFVAKSNEKVPVLFSSSSIVDQDGRVTGYIGVAKDVSDLRKLEARMQQSEKLSAVGQLAAGVAHEINNPLGVILGFAQGMARQLKPGDALEMPIKSIEREALRCKALVQNLLTFARTSQSERAAMDVNSAMEQALSLIAPHAKVNRVAVTTKLAAGLPPVLGNKNQVEQIIMNLAKNAIDAMPNGGTLELSSELFESAPHSWVRLKFLDDGAGIPPDVLSKIFDPFFTTKPIGQGTGLGLSLVSEIVQKHSGEISVESRPGRTEFTVKLPVRTGREQERAVAAGVKGSISHG